jgi:hypothetical protein
MLVIRLKTIALLLIFSSLVSDCKVRRNISGLAEGGDYSAEFTQIQEKIMEIQLWIKNYNEGQHSLVDEGVLNYVKSRQGKPGNLVAKPAQCQLSDWNKDLAWNNDMIAKLEDLSKKSPHYMVRMTALKELSTLVRKNGMTCGAEKLRELVPLAMKDSEPVKELLANPNEKPQVYACSSLLRCSFALEVGVVMGKNFPNLDVGINMLKSVADTVQYFSFSGSMKNIVTYRARSSIAFLKFIRFTRITDPEMQGVTLVFSPMDPQYTDILNEYDQLRREFDAEFQMISAPDTDEYRVAREYISGFARNEIVNQDILNPEVTDYFVLDPDKRELIDQYVQETIFKPAVDNYWFNRGMRLYLERMTMADPQKWLAQVRRRVEINQAWNEEEQLLRDGAPLSEPEKEEMFRKFGLNIDDPNHRAIDPEIAFIGVTAFVGYEVFLPYRSDFLNLIQFLTQKIPVERRMNYIPKMQEVATYYGAFGNYLGSYANQALTYDQDDLMLSKEKLAEVDRVRAMHKRILERELDIVRTPGWQSFQSLHHQLMRYNHLMSLRGVALGKLVDELRSDDFTKTTVFHWNDLDYGWWGDIDRWVPVFFDPDSKVNRAQFDIDNALGDLIGQYLTLECTDRVHTRGGQAKGLKIVEKFYLEDSDIKFDCKKGESFTDLRSRAAAYGRSIAKEKIDDKLARAIKENPFLHAAIMVGMSAVAPHVTMVFMRLASSLAAVVPPAVHAMTVMRYASNFGKLILDSWIFGVGDYYVMGALDKTLGVKMTPQEHEAHASAMWNVKGIIQGAVIFGLIPFAHGGMDKLVRGSIGNRVLGKDLVAKVTAAARTNTRVTYSSWKEMSRAGSLWTLSMGAQASAEAGIFIFQPMIMEKWEEAKLRFAGTYREPDEMEKLWMKLYGPTKYESALGTLVTVAAFSTNRVLGHGVHQNGYPSNLKNELAFWGVRARAALGMKRSQIERNNPYEILGVGREATADQIREAYEYRMQVAGKKFDSFRMMGLNVKSSQLAEFSNAAKRLIFAKKALLGEIDWAAPNTMQLKFELERYGLDFIVLKDKTIDPTINTQNKPIESDWVVNDANFFPPVPGARGNTTPEMRKRIDAALYGKRAPAGQAPWEGSKIVRDGDHDAMLYADNRVQPPAPAEANPAAGQAPTEGGAQPQGTNQPQGG